MKKLLTILAFVTLCSAAANAQEVGIRLGEVVGGNAAIDAVFSTGKFSRIHADLSFGNGVGAEALWDFIYRPLGDEAFNWYAGFGPSMRIDDPFFFGVSGEIGLEYRFKTAPVALGVDWRPTFWIVENTEFAAEGFGFNARYIFGKK